MYIYTDIHIYAFICAYTHMHIHAALFNPPMAGLSWRLLCLHFHVCYFYQLIDLYHVWWCFPSRDKTTSSMIPISFLNCTQLLQEKGWLKSNFNIHTCLTDQVDFYFNVRYPFNINCFICMDIRRILWINCLYTSNIRGTIKYEYFVHHTWTFITLNYSAIIFLLQFGGIVHGYQENYMN